MAKYKIDPVLEEQLKKRGMTDKLTELQSAAKKTSTASNFLPALSDTLKRVGTGISDFLGTSVLGQAYGGAMATGYVDKLQRETTRTNQELGNNIIKQIKNPNIPKENKEKLVKMYSNINPSIASGIPELEVNDKDILSNSAKLALNIALMGKSPLALEAKAVGGQGIGYIAPTVARELTSFANATNKLTSVARVANYGKIGQAANLVEKFGPQIAYDFLLGSAYGVADATGKNKSIDEVKQEGVTMGVINATAPVVGGLVLRGLGQGLKYTGKGVAGVTNSLRNKAEAYALGTTVEQRLAESKGLADELLSIYEPVKTKGQEMAAKFVNAIDYVKEIPQKLFDAGKPLDKYSRQAYLEYRLGSDSARAKAVDAKYTIANDIFSKDAEVFKQQKAKMALLDQLDRARLGDKTTLDGGDVDLLEERLAKLEIQHKDLGISEQVQKAVDDFNDFNKTLLQEKVDAGFISKETLDKLIETHPNYIPHSTVAKTLDESTPAFATQTKNPSKSTIVASTGGSERALEDPIQTIFDRLDNHYQAISNSKLTDSLIKDAPEGLFTKVDEFAEGAVGKQAQLEQGLMPINRWNNGVKETYLVPEEVAIAVKNLNQEPLTGFVKHWGAINNVFKKLTTGYNLPFAVNNLAKDRQTAYISADALISKFLKDAGLPESTRTKIGLDTKGLVDLYRRTGGSGADIYSDAGFKQAQKTFEDMRKSGFATVVDNSYRPDKWIKTINSELEKSTRLNVFKQALERGVPVQEATLIARDATVDFSKMGTQMKNLNQIFPFLNARVQGASNMLKAAEVAPEKFARSMYYTSVIPTVLLDQYNSQFESNKNINSNISDNYWYVITGEEDATDRDGRAIKIPNVVALKKGEMQQIGSIAVKEFLNRMRNENPKSAQEISFKLLGSVSPIGTGGYNPSSWWTAPIAATGPIAKTMVGLGTNIDPYTGLSIVPDSKLKNSPELQYSDNNKQLTKQIGETLGISPAKIEFVIGSFGAVPKQALQTADVTQGLVQGEGVRSNALTTNGFSNAANLPWVDNFLKQGAYIGSEDYKAGLKTEQEIQTKEADISLKNKETANLLVDQAYKITNLEDRKRWLKEQESNYPESVISRAKTEYRARNAEGYLRPDMDNAVISQFVYQELQKMSKDNMTSEQKIEYLDTLFNKGIISPTAKKEIQGLNQYGIYIDDVENAPTESQRINNILASVGSMKDKEIDKKYITLFLDKIWNDGFITPDTKPLVVQGVKEIFSK